VTPLHIASRNEYKECIITLLNAGANINEKDTDGRTPLDLGSDEIKELIKQWIVHIRKNEIPISLCVSKEPC
jgi:hypothetical protein